MTAREHAWLKRRTRKADLSRMGKLAVSLALLATSAYAADQEVIESTFIKPWVKALQSKDKDGLERLFHPAVRACINSSTQEFFDVGIQRLMDPVPSGPYLITKLAPWTGPFPAFLPEDGFRSPVQPTYEMNLQFDESDEVLAIFLAKSGGGWLEVFPCPNEKGMAYFRQSLVDYAAAEKKAADLVAALRDPLLGELKDLLRKREKGEAIEKYRAATSADFGTAVRVINALQKSNQ
jgi:hypothetical protein